MSNEARDGPIGIERVGHGVVARLRDEAPRDEDLERLDGLIRTSAAAPGVSVVVLDLSRVTALPSHGLGMLVKLSGDCEARGQRLKLAGVSPELRETLRVTRLDRALTVVESVQAGLR